VILCSAGADLFGSSVASCAANVDAYVSPIWFYVFYIRNMSHIDSTISMFSYKDTGDRIN
jgi:hypothetical protein